MKILKFALPLIVLTVFLLIPGIVFAQDPGPCPDCPIDSGVVMLIAAAIGIAVKKHYDNKKKNLNSDII